MAKPDPERSRRFLELITRGRGGIEAVLPHLEGSRGEGARGGFESLPNATKTTVKREGLEAVESVARGRLPDPNQTFGLEAIINAELRPAVDVVNSKFTMVHPLWRHMSDDAAIRKLIEERLPRVGRIELPGNDRYPYGGTGFIVGAGLVMTNRHVAEIFSTGLGDRSLRFIGGAQAGIDLHRENGGLPGTTLRVRHVAMIHPYWDMALLSVEGLPADATPLPLSLLDARDLKGREIFIVGYPAFDPRNPSGEQQGVFRGTYGVKRLQPGELQGGDTTSSFGKLVNVATHDCSTLGGNSGSAVFDMKTGDVLALHFGGLYHERNFCVPAQALSTDARVVDAGVIFADTPSRGPNSWSDWWARADADEAPARPSPPSPPIAAKQSPAAAGPSERRDRAVVAEIAGPGVTIEIPLRIMVSLGSAAPAEIAMGAGETTAAGAFTETLVEPFHDTDYDDRGGYDPEFLGKDLPLPMPTVKDASVLAKTAGGDDTLTYQNFSVRMNGARRLAAVCASNIAREQVLRRPEANKEYSRKALGDLGKNDQEKWFLDRRLDEKYQLPDVFFTKDQRAFDKGHIVRREDVAWGRTYEELRRANGDTFHATNCSPQVAGYNRSNAGEDNWGDLENIVFSQAASERLCVFAGPVLDPADEVFVGTASNWIPLRAKIPSRFWKIIVARGDGGMGAFGFVLEQDLADVPLEFTVPPEFLPKMVPLSAIADMAGLAFDKTLLDADQFDTEKGIDIAARGGTRRRRARTS